MPNVIDNFLQQLAGLLGPLSPFAKAVVPAALALAYAIVRSVADHTIDAVAIATAASGVVLAIATYFVPNKAHAHR